MMDDRQRLFLFGAQEQTRNVRWADALPIGLPTNLVIGHLESHLVA